MSMPCHGGKAVHPEGLALTASPSTVPLRASPSRFSRTPHPEGFTLRAYPEGFWEESKGGVAPLVAVLMAALVSIFFMMLLGLAQLRLIREEVYRAADLAAVAGAQQLDFQRLIQGELRLEPGAPNVARNVLRHNLQHIENHLAERAGRIAHDAEIVVCNPGDARPYGANPSGPPDVWISVEAPVSWLGEGMWESNVRVVARAIVQPP